MPAPEEASREAGRPFAGRYRLERRLGIGGMATVQLAMDTRLERYVAVKLLAEHLAEDSSFVSRFRREALAAARLVHPNVVQVFDFGLDDSTHRNFIVMEFVDGPSCAEILREQGTLAPAEAVDILAQSCRGLDYAHRNGVVHRDVKPGDLLRSNEGMVKLADFGIAKAAEQSDITKVGSVLGTRRLPGAGAGPRRAGRTAVGHVRARRRRLPADGGAAAVRRRLAHRPRTAAGHAARRRGSTSSSPTCHPRSRPPSRAPCTAIRSSATPTPARWRPPCATACAAARPPAAPT